MKRSLLFLVMMFFLFSCEKKTNKSDNDDLIYGQIKLKTQYKRLIQSFIQQKYPEIDSVIYRVNICQGYFKTRLTISYLKDLGQLEQSKPFALFKMDSSWVIICDGLMTISEPDSVYNQKSMAILKNKVESRREPTLFHPKIWVCGIENDSIHIDKQPEYAYELCPPTQQAIMFIPPHSNKKK